MSKSALLFLLIFFGGLIAAVFFLPVASFLVYQLVYFINPDDSWWSASIPGLRYSFTVVVIMILTLAVNYRNYTERAAWGDQPILKWLLAILIMYMIMLNFAIVPALHKRFLIDFVKLIVIIFVAYKLVNTERALDACLWAYILGATYIGIVVYQTGRNSGDRVEGLGMVDTGGDSNMVAAALAPSLVILIYMAWLGNKKIKALTFFCGALIANGVVLINSRGAFLGVVLGAAFFLFYMLFSKYRRKGQRGTAIFVILAGLSGGLYVADDTFWERMQTLTLAQEDAGASGSRRTDYWRATFDVMEDYPMGVGIGGFQVVSKQYLPSSNFVNRDIGRAVHSTWFQLLGELGWPGPILFIGLLITITRLSGKTKRSLIAEGRYEAYFKMLALEGALLAYLICATFIDRSRAEILYWLILFIAIGVNVYYLQSAGQRTSQVAGAKKTKQAACASQTDIGTKRKKAI